MSQRSKQRARLVTAMVTAGQVGLVVLLLVGWQLGADHHVIDPSYFSKPTAVVSYLRAWAQHQSGSQSTGTTLGQDLTSSLVVFGFGYVIGLGVGAALGILIGTVPLARQILEPYIAFVNAIPKLILMPILLVIFGFGYVPQVALVVSVIVMFVAINIAAGVSETSRVILAHCTMLGATRWQLIRYVYVPSLSIWVLSTSRVSVGYAIQGSIAAQLVGSDRGLGFRIVDAASSFRSDEMFAAFVVLMALVLVIDFGLSMVERRATRWMPELVSK